MTKKQLKIRRLLGLKILAVFLAAAAVPQANAGVLDRMWDVFSVDSGATGYHGSYFTGYNPITPAYESAEAAASSQVIINEGFILAQNSPVRQTKSTNIKYKVIEETVVPASAYSSTPDQTDDSPFITASGTKVRDGVVAANFLPIGTKIKIPEIFGDKIFIVEDRMNKRYWHKIDVWFPDRESALEFGVRTLKIQILES